MDEREQEISTLQDQLLLEQNKNRSLTLQIQIMGTSASTSTVSTSPPPPLKSVFVDKSVQVGKIHDTTK